MDRIERGTCGGGWLLDQMGRAVSHGVERSDAARNRHRILSSARALFEERGVTMVTMEQIAHSARVGKGTLYRRFRTKVRCVRLFWTSLHVSSRRKHRSGS